MSHLDDPILIITGEYDPHADDVVRELNRAGAPVVRMHPRDLPMRATASLEFDAACVTGAIRLPGGRAFSPHKVRSAWYRRPEPGDLPPRIDPLWADFARAQTAHLVYGLWQMMDCYWVSPPAALRAAEYKPYQLQLARRLGLSIPRTLITNDPAAAREFYAAAPGRVVYKPLRATPITVVVGAEPSDQPALPLLYTTVLTDQHMAEIDAIQCAAGIFQEYVPKRVELRITIMGRRIFAAEIHSQAHERTRHDWRRYPEDLNDLPHYPHELPPGLQTQLRAMLDRLGLQFGAIDMILTPAGEYVFLEINPNGQWLWVEDLTGQPMLETFVKMLVEARPASAT